MAAGLGSKTFTTGEVLTAADVNGYLMQGILVFASAAARDAAITSPQEGQYAFLKDTDVTYYYDGAAWVVSGGGMTNPMTTTGDVIYSSSGSTPARLGIGTALQVLRTNAGATAPEWATSAAATTAYTLLNAGGTALTGASTITISGLSGYNSLFILSEGYIDTALGGGSNFLRFNADSGANYSATGYRITGTSGAVHTTNAESWENTAQFLITEQAGSQGYGRFAMTVNAANSTGIKVVEYKGLGGGGTSGDYSWAGTGRYKGTSVISSFSISNTQVSNYQTGTIFIFGA